MDDKVINLLEKMYADLSGRIDGLSDRIHGMDEELRGMRTAWRQGKSCRE